MIAKPRQEIVSYWWQKAQESLSSARLELKAGSCSFAMNRLYYAAFYGVCAVMLEHEQSFRKHSGVRAAFHRQFIKTGVLEKRWGRLYDQRFEDRQEGDYVVFVSFEPEYVEHQLNPCTGFLDELANLLSSLGESR